MEMEIETRKYENGDYSFVKKVEGKYQLEVFVSCTHDINGNVVLGHYTANEMILTVYNLPGIHESISHMVGELELKGDLITGYGGGAHDKLVVEDKEIVERIRFLTELKNNIN